MAPRLANGSGGVMLKLIRELRYLVCGYSHSAVQRENLPPDPWVPG